MTESGVSVRIFCHGEATWAIKSVYGWFCNRCDERVKVVW